MILQRQRHPAKPEGKTINSKTLEDNGVLSSSQVAWWCGHALFGLSTADNQVTIKWLWRVSKTAFRWQSHVCVYAMVNLWVGHFVWTTVCCLSVWRLLLGEFSPGLVCHECRMSPVYEMLTAPSCLPGHESKLLLLHWRPRFSSWPPNSTPTWLNEQPWVGQLMGGWDMALAVAKWSLSASRNSTWALQLLDPELLFWVK